MTVAEQKATLLDSFVRQIKKAGNDMKYIGLLADYDSIKDSPTFTEDPYLDEVFTGRLLNLFKYRNDLTEWHKNMRVSEIPDPEKLKHRKGWGKVSMKEYTEIFNKYRT